MRFACPLAGRLGSYAADRALALRGETLAARPAEGRLTIPVASRGQRCALAPPRKLGAPESSALLRSAPKVTRTGTCMRPSQHAFGVLVRLAALPPRYARSGRACSPLLLEPHLSSRRFFVDGTQRVGHCGQRCALDARPVLR